MSLRRTTRTPNFVTTSAVDEWRLEAVMASLLDLSDNQGRLLCPPFRVLESKEVFFYILKKMFFLIFFRSFQYIMNKLKIQLI